ALSVNDNVVDLVFRPGSQPGEPCRISPSPDTTFLRFINRTRTVEAGGSPTIRLYRALGENVVHASGTLPVEGTRHVDSVTVHQPARWFVALFHEALRERGIHVSGRLHTANWLDRQTRPLDVRELVELGSAPSRPMSELAARMMKDSQNLYAQLLLLQVGARSISRDRHPTTEAAGLAELGEFLDEMGIARSEVLLEEGSGLSRGALLTPDATVRLLSHMTRHPLADVFRDSLPVAGVDGTLGRRLAGTVAAGNVHAKTGALRYVNTLSGYGRTTGGENLAFSLMLNNYREPHPAHSGRNEIDALVVMLMEFAGRSRDAEGEP
ncbi:MAG TPA: D-alanyl-D-alanine carboxypeptidase/D-alanyl-D-alanine-endopeptidase, partial [Methylomirabilota bacterium]|nr:D-alanyl-D-alanine carboxypeptidase/D-alanyl-D-alanine-endopeptidase [Methylomirabilota bacterium]